MPYYGKREFPKNGKWREAIIATDVDQINRNQEPEHFPGQVIFPYRNIEKKRGYSEPVAGLEARKYSEIIETFWKINFKEGDSFISQEGTQYEVIETEEYIPKKHENAVRLYPGLKDRYAIKKVYLK